MSGTRAFLQMTIPLINLSVYFIPTHLSATLNGNTKHINSKKILYGKSDWDPDAWSITKNVNVHEICIDFALSLMTCHFPETLQQ